MMILPISAGTCLESVSHNQEFFNVFLRKYSYQLCRAHAMLVMVQSLSRPRWIDRMEAALSILMVVMRAPLLIPQNR